MRLTVIEDGRGSGADHRDLRSRIIRAYSGIIRLYCLVRFQIIRIRFLEEIEQYLPSEGTIVDLGCGFGLFALYMAARKPRAHVIGIDLSASRLAIARTAARRLDITNVTFLHTDLREWRPVEGIAAAYALDVFHHVPVAIGNRLLRDLFACIGQGGRFVLKDIDTTPRPMLWFTYVLDVLMSPRDDFQYRSAAAWQTQLDASGFRPIHLHYLWDILPYPHILLICDRPGAQSSLTMVTGQAVSAS